MGKKLEKTKIWFKTSFWVYIYAATLALVMLLQTGIGLLQIDEIRGPLLERFGNISFIVNILNGQLQMPIKSLAILWVGVCAAYVGVDRAAYAFKSAHRPTGTIDVGNPEVLRGVIFISFAILMLGIVCNSFVDFDFELNSLGSAFGSSVAFYVAGQKAIKCTKYVDLDGDGIPDEVYEDEDEYEEDDGAEEGGYEEPETTVMGEIIGAAKEALNDEEVKEATQQFNGVRKAKPKKKRRNKNHNTRKG